MRDYFSHAVPKLWSSVVLVLLIVTVAGVASLIGDRILLRSVTEAFIYVVVVVGIYVFMGNSGVMSFGSIAFMAIGAYASAWQTCCSAMKAMLMTGLPDFLRYHTVPVLPAAITSGLLAATVALLVGIPILRLSGIPASIATLAFLGIINVSYSNWSSVTLGTRSVVGLPLYVNVWVALGWAVVAIVCAHLYQNSRFGIALRAAREDEVAARAIGINVAGQRLIAWIVSAFLVGVGGVLYGHFVGVITVSAYYLGMTFITLAMLVVGGTRSLTGAVIGVLVIQAIIEVLRRFEGGIELGAMVFKAPPGIQEIALGLLMLLVLVLRPRGITNGQEIPWPFPRAVKARHSTRSSAR